MQPSIRPAAGARAGSPSARAERLSSWLAASQLGLVVVALLVGGLAGLGAVLFRWLIYTFTWLATGHQQFGQQGRVGSLHVPWLGVGFLLLIPVVGGLLYGPLIQRFASEARGHGVPEVMLAVAENGGRIRPQVSVVKALASALCIATGGSVGREGPIVQIGAALASTLGQLARFSEARLRVIVACGAAGGIAATFNAPITGLFFGFEIVLREFSLEAVLATSLSAVAADLVGRAFFGSAPFFAALPGHLLPTHDTAYLLIALLGLGAGLVGVGFKTFLYALEERADELWRGRPEWARPAVGGVLLGCLLLALPQMYGVGYPVMDRLFAGHEALWLLVILMLGKMLAASLTLSIGGSGGVFAPSLFTGAAGGMAYGVLAQRLLGPAAGPPALYGVIAMGGVFAGAAQAPLTAIASVVEMTGDFSLTLAVMLAAGISAALSRRLSYGSIYTSKLLRRGIDIDRARPESALQSLRVASVMSPLHEGNGGVGLRVHASPDRAGAEPWEPSVGSVAERSRPQALFAEEDLEQALRQLILYGRHGLPVLSHDAGSVCGWITREDVLGALAERVRSVPGEIERGALAADYAGEHRRSHLHVPSAPLQDYEMLELELHADSEALGSPVSGLALPDGAVALAIWRGGSAIPANDSTRLARGDRLIVLAPNTADAVP